MLHFDARFLTTNIHVADPSEKPLAHLHSPPDLPLKILRYLVPHTIAVAIGIRVGTEASLTQECDLKQRDTVACRSGW